MVAIQQAFFPLRFIRQRFVESSFHISYCPKLPISDQFEISELTKICLAQAVNNQ